MDVDFILHVEASQPITGSILLRWTINGAGPYTFSAQMVDGVYERTFACESTGNWTIWFEWEGDEVYSPAQSNSVTVHINPGTPPSDSTMLIMIVMAVVVVAAIGLAYSYFRDKKR